MATKKMGVTDIVTAVENLSALELSELVHSLEDRFGVSAMAPAAAVAVQGAAVGAEGEAESEAKEAVDVVLTATGEKKIQVLKEIRGITGLGLKEAKALVDSIPGVVKEEAEKEEALQIKEKLEAAGATVELK